MMTTAGLPVSFIRVDRETVYEYADGSVRRNRGSGKWVKLTKNECAAIAELPRILVSDLKPGAKFSTDYESGCEVVTPPDELTNFNAYDSERVLCTFFLGMVASVDS